MSFQTPLTINEVISKIHSKKYLLPSIQREFVWDTNQIMMLFDSLMRDYPINAFLFWEVGKENLNEFMFYEFLRDYHQVKNFHNEKADLKGNESIIAVLDGQQRLPSLYIGLKGSYAYKLSYRRWDNPNAYPVRKLYLNLLQPSEDSEWEYEFDFLTETEARGNDSTHFWFMVGDILDMKSLSDVMKYWSKHIVYGNHSSKQCDFANETLSKLYEVIHVSPTICYYLEDSAKLDKVLNIFIRVNSGGTTLSYSDLLLSFATAQWDKLDARKVIYDFVDEINEMGGGFHITKDFVLKSCLVLCDFEDISFKVDNFNRTNMLKIQEEWENITKAIRGAVALVAGFGFNRENITSNNLFIPIAYYLKRIGLPDNFDSSSAFLAQRIEIKKWFTRSLLKKVFSFMPDGALKPIRELIRSHSTDNHFPLQEITERFKGTNRSLLFTDDDISNLLWAKYGQGITVVIMSVLYPWADLKNHFHIDHMYPKSKFTRKQLKKHGLTDDQVEFAIKNHNYLGNLQLLEAIPNIEKSNCDFDLWLQDTIPLESLADYKAKHLIPPNIELTYGNFYEFLSAREVLITEKLKKELT